MAAGVVAGVFALPPVGETLAARRIRVWDHPGPKARLCVLACVPVTKEVGETLAAGGIRTGHHTGSKSRTGVLTGVASDP